MDVVVSAPRLPVLGETVLGSALGLYPGGKGANQAVAASRLGATVRFVGVVGDDEWGSKIRSVLAADGVDLQWLRSTEKKPTGVGTIVVLPDGTNAITVAPGANETLSEEHVEAAGQAIRTADVVVLQGEVPRAANLRAVELAKDASAFILMNAAPASQIDRNALEAVNLLVVNEGEARTLLDLSDSSVAPGGLARRLVTLGPDRVVLTIGCEGAVYFDGKDLLTLDAFEVECVDSTAAGDAFVAALAVHRAEGERVRDCLRAACAAGALAVGKKGAIPSLPARTEVESFLSAHALPVQR